MEETFFMVKPDSMKKKVAGKIISRLEDEGFEIINMKLNHLSKEITEKFYGEHKGKVFFERLVDFMISGPSLQVVLKRDNAVAHLRKIVGATVPSEADPGTIRAEYGEGAPNNGVHASDSVESAQKEIGFFFG